MKNTRKIKITKLSIIIMLVIVGLLGVLTSSILVLAQDKIMQEVRAEVIIGEIKESERKSRSVEKQELKVTKVVEVPIEHEIIKEEVIDPFKLKDIGVYSLTAYCPCKKCCGQFGGSPVNKIGSVGTGVYEGVTVAVDPKKIPYGTKLYIEGVGVRIAGDCGGAIKGNRIDVYYKTHKEALASGLGYTKRRVYIIEDNISMGI